MADKFVDASYSCEEKPGWVKLIMPMRGLKVHREGCLSCFNSKKVPVPQNAHILEPRFTERTVLVQVEGKGKLKDKNIQLRINRLPYDIEDGSCYIEPDDGRVMVFLKKAESEQSWKSYINGKGIETDDS